MEYVSSIERIKLEQKRQEWTQECESAMLSRLLTRRFGELPQWAQERIKKHPNLKSNYGLIAEWMAEH